MKKQLTTICLLVMPLLLSAQNLEVRPDKKGRLGYFDQEGKEVIRCQFDEAEPFQDGYAKVLKGDKYMFIDMSGKAVTEKYTVLEVFGNTDLYLVADGGTLTKPNESVKGRETIPTKVFRGSTSYGVKGAKWGLLSLKTGIVVKPDYDEMSDLLNGTIYVIKDGKIGFYDENYNLVLKPTYQFMGMFNNQGLAWVKNGASFKDGKLSGGKMSIVNRKGELVIPLKFENVGTFEVPDRPEYSSKQINAVEMVPFKPLSDSDSPYLWYCTKGIQMPGIIDNTGAIKVPEKMFSTVFLPTDGMVEFVRLKDKKKNLYEVGFFDIDRKKEFVPDQDYTFFPFQDGTSVARRKDNTLFYIVDKDFHEVSDRYNEGGDFVEGLSVVVKGQKFGAINRQGQIVIPLEYNGALSSFTEDKLGVKEGDKWGFIDKNRQTVIPFEYSSVGGFQNGFAGVSRDELWGVIDQNNQEMLPIMWKGFIASESATPDYFWVKDSDDKYYYYDLKTKEVLFPEKKMGYTNVSYFLDNPYCIVQQGANFGAVFRDGSICIPIEMEKKEDIDKAVNYLRKNNIDKFKPVDLMRFKIVLRGTSNKYKLTDRIPETEWNY